MIIRSNNKDEGIKGREDLSICPCTQILRLEKVTACSCACVPRFVSLEHRGTGSLVTGRIFQYSNLAMVLGDFPPHLGYR